MSKINVPVWLMNTMVGAVLVWIFSVSAYMMKWNVADAAHKASVIEKLNGLVDDMKKVESHMQLDGHPKMEVRMDAIESWRDRHEIQARE